MKQLFFVLLFWGSVVAAQETQVSKEAAAIIETTFGKSTINRFSKNEKGFYAEVLALDKLYVVELNSKGEILNKELVFSVPDALAKKLRANNQPYKIEDVRDDEKGNMQIEIISANTKQIYNIDKEGRLTETK
jgi:hypothetical protein